MRQTCTMSLPCLQDDITLQLSWLFRRASFGLTRSTVEGKRRKIEGFG
ncbi:hypothetical protein SLEP1_g41096 [Rubroshorea leprosula]|uniref:Uncharacterized protein n=1 Tax=Rubroshorea leprosula TaxID=152421 RepID=A0AAV5L5M0_9ROSI|nr:hypothetical protein SLEP1_g41096 [Rubroshorea leprosula]